MDDEVTTLPSFSMNSYADGAKWILYYSTEHFSFVNCLNLIHNTLFCREELQVGELLLLDLFQSNKSMILKKTTSLGKLLEEQLELLMLMLVILLKADQVGMSMFLLQFQEMVACCLLYLKVQLH